MAQYQVGAATAAERVTHQTSTVLFAGQRGPVPVCLTVLFPCQPTLVVQVVHGGHDGGVGDLPFGDEFVEYHTNSRGRSFAVPDPIHDDRLEFAESARAHVDLLLPLYGDRRLSQRSPGETSLCGTGFKRRPVCGR